MTSLIWLHEDSLRDTHPVFNHVAGDYHAFFIWDNEYFKQVDYGFNRLSFIYEAMSDLPFTIYEGEIASVISELATEFSSNQLYVANTPNRMINETRAGQLMDGYRGEGPYDREAVIDALVAVGKMAVDNSTAIESLDINPLVALSPGDGAYALDALAVLKRETIG